MGDGGEERTFGDDHLDLERKMKRERDERIRRRLVDERCGNPYPHGTYINLTVIHLYSKQSVHCGTEELLDPNGRIHQHRISLHHNDSHEKREVNYYMH